MGIKIIPPTIKHFNSIEGQAHSKENGIQVLIKIFTAEFEGEIKPDNEIDKVGYLTLSEVPDTSDLGWEYLKKLKNKGLID